MTLPFAAGKPLLSKDFQSLRTSLIFDCCKWDIQSEDHSVIADFPLFLDSNAWTNIAALAEKLSEEAIAAEQELCSRRDLHSLLNLPGPVRKLCSECLPHRTSKGAARVMRFDFHFTTEGWRISEVNADVPSGFIEASGLTALMASHYHDCFLPPNPTLVYIDAICSAAGPHANIALIHATAHSDDRQVMEYLSRALHQRGIETVFAAPNHVEWDSGVANVNTAFASSKPAAIIRFFPAEWLPNLRPASSWQPWFATV